jgi:hypothetical protein
MTVSVIIPWESDDPTRKANLVDVLTYFGEEFPDWRVFLSPTGGDFNRARAINRGVAATSGDVLVFNDADTLVHPVQLERAVQLASEAPGIVYAYTRYCRLSQFRTEVLNGDYPTMLRQTAFVWELDNAGSQGCIALSRAFFEEAGGLDEEFEGWGFEDLAFAAVCAKLADGRRVPGNLIHLWHPPHDGRSEEDRDRCMTAGQLRNLRRYETIYLHA